MSRKREIVEAQPTPLVEAEAGFMLVYVVLLAVLVLIALSVAAPILAKELRRDKEVESEHRANEYVRAIRLYYRKTHAYPPSIAALEGTNNIRFLRKQYIDPLTGKSDWRIIHLGENKTTVKGFFGQPLSGLNTSGAGGGVGSASTLGTGFGGAASATGGTTSTIGTTSGLAAGFQGATIGSSGSSGTPGATGTSGATGANGSGTGSTTGTSSTDSSSGSLGLIMGVGTSKTGPSILDPNAQTTYETWEFLYDPLIEQMYAKSSILGGGITSTPASGFGSNAVTGQPNSGASSPSTGFGSTPTSPSTPSTPTAPPQNSPF
jgi:type II secretory pathway pseudopilin PulG